ncbi:MAG: hypothetical protein EXX96DRAFT_475749 [Benjaminiella poitrasii]|nr:MAG: hypothetical protein EXX96DRAFT_475749 [Benjaminiella poitrasii]
MTEVCRDLLSLLNNSTGTSTSINTQIRQFIGTHHSLDESEYADYYFTESMVLHFPRNPISFSMKERTAAPITTIYLLHNLFLSCNDLISLHWIERTTEITGDVKWDGICFSLQDKRFTPVLIEFSGGIKFNSTVSFEALYLIDDEQSIIKRSFCKIVCPTTPRELKSFAKNIPDLLKWKQAIISAVIESRK